MLTLVAATQAVFAQFTTPSYLSAAGSFLNPTNTPRAYVIGKGAHHRTWESVSMITNAAGDITQKTNTIEELATGMHYFGAAGWTPSDPRFVDTTNGFLAAKVHHRIRLQHDLNVGGAVCVALPNQKEIYSTPVALGIYQPENGHFLVIGEITTCTGVLVSNNVVAYQDPFVDAQGRRLCGSLVYILGQGSFEQDYVWQGFFDVRAYGFTTNALVQVISEIQSAPEADIIQRPLYIEQNPLVRNSFVSPDVIDQIIGFGEFVLSTGQAYTALGIGQTNGTQATVVKELRQDNDRLLLIESVRYSELQKGFQTLPPCNPVGQGAVSPKSGSKTAYAAIASPPKIAKADRPPAKRSSETAKLKERPAGVVIDYVATIGGTLTGTRLFASSTNYVITANVTCNGQVVVEGGTIFKYKVNTSMAWYNSPTLKTSSYRPAVFTALDDTSLGDPLSTSVDPSYTGNVNTYPNGYANPAISCSQGTYTFSNCRFCYAQAAIKFNNANPASLTVNHSQFWKCTRGIWLAYSCGGCCSGCGTCGASLYVNNTLMGYVTYPLTLPQVVPPSSLLANCTFDHATTLLSGWNGFSMTAKNCIFANITSWGWTPSGDHNGFDHAPAAFGTSQFPSKGPPFQVVGAGSYYLTDVSGFRDAGTTSGIASSLLMDLRTRTTRPPVIIPQNIQIDMTLAPEKLSDSDPIDLGYHYNIVDYGVSGLFVSGCKLTVVPGTVIATYTVNSPPSPNIPGFTIDTGGQLSCIGTPTQPVWIVEFNTVQEGSTTAWQKTTFASIASSTIPQAPYPIINFRFTDWSMLGLDDYHFRAPGGLGPFNFQDCEFHGGMLRSRGPTLNLTNCLLERAETDILPGDGLTSYFRNNLMFGGKFGYGPANSVIRDNLFDQTRLNVSGSFTASRNAYVSTYDQLSGDSSPIVLTVSPTYLSGPLGGYYLADTMTQLIDQGSTTADQVGLYHYTVRTTLQNNLEIKERATQVDVCYHHVATDPNGNPIATDGSFADYLKDSNGDGLYDAGDFSNWQVSDTDGDGVSDYTEYIQGRNPRVAGSVSDTTGAINLQVYTPFK